MSPLVDAAERERIRTSLDETIVVEAAAGTGKTTELVNRIINLLGSGRARVDQLAVLTFTEKAAGELKLRLRAGLERARAELPADTSPDATGRRFDYERALAHLEEAHVSTIHGFCADLLRERPVEAGIDPRFEVTSEAAAHRLYAQAFDQWLEEQLADVPEGVRRSLRRLSRWVDDDGPTARLRRAGWTLADWRDFPAAWAREAFDREAEIDALLQRVNAFATLTERASRKASDRLYQQTRPARLLSESVRAAERIRPRDHDEVEARLVSLAFDRELRDRRHGHGAHYGEGLRREEVLQQLTALLDDLRAFARRADADLAARLQAELRGSIERYERMKARTGRLDFVDLLVRARDLVRDHADVRTDFQRRFAYIFVDEFQDTDPLQAEILMLLASRDPGVTEWRQVSVVPGKLFVVGDPKQSIYRFRRADVGAYRDVARQLERDGGTLLTLRTSFRAVPGIQRAVNTAFEPLMTGDDARLQATYVPLAPSREDQTAQPALVALPVPRPYGAWRVTGRAIEASLPDAVGAFVAWLLEESGWTVTEREAPAERVPVRSRHVCILFRRFETWGTDVTRDYVAALEARRVPHLLIGGRSFHNRQEVEAMRAALSAVEWPDDELAVFATVRGPLFAVPDDRLLAYRQARGHLHPFRVGTDLPEELAPVGAALRLLAGLHRERNDVPVAETIGRLLEATRAHAGFVLRRGGEQALANVLQIAEMARQYEGSGGISFRGFVEDFRESAEAGQASEAPILEEGTEGVRLMTVHRAKGLEFPVVILADITARLAPRQAARYIDPQRQLCAVRLAGWAPADLLQHEPEEVAREEAEGIRIAYVASTRARDLLVVPAVGDEPFAGHWASPLNAAIYPPVDDRGEAEAASGCPPPGRDSVLERPDDGPPLPTTVRPGGHRMPGGYDVVWWDPRVLRLDAGPPREIRHYDLLGKQATGERMARDLDRYRQWEQRRRETVTAAAVPSLVVQPATAWALTAATRGDPPPSVEVIECRGAGDRPGGVRFGTLVHAMLAWVALDADLEAIRAAAALQARVLGADAREIASAVDAVHGVLTHPILERARQAARRGECRRETPVAETLGDGVVVEGVVDLAFEEPEGWTIVDFKTDRDLEEGLPAYRHQVALYAEAIARATGRAAHPIIIRL